MPGPEDLSTLVAELYALPARQRRAILEVLTPFERTQVNLLLAEASADIPSTEPEDGTHRLSPWLAERVRAKDGETTMTGATAAVLAELARQLRRPGDDTAAAPVQPAAPSLLELAWGALTPRRGRP